MDPISLGLLVKGGQMLWKKFGSSGGGSASSSGLHGIARNIATYWGLRIGQMTERCVDFCISDPNGTFFVGLTEVRPGQVLFRTVGGWDCSSGRLPREAQRVLNEARRHLAGNADITELRGDNCIGYGVDIDIPLAALNPESFKKLVEATFLAAAQIDRELQRRV